MHLPIAKLRSRFMQAFASGPVVVTAPTGSGKSTLVPSWCHDLRGPTLVVEPRRVACRALWRFTHVDLGLDSGYIVRHAQTRPEAPILYVTTGVALKMARDRTLDRFQSVVLDEFHERSLGLDLLAAILKERADRQGLVIMSATLDARRIASWLGAQVLLGEGRQHPVTVRYLPAGTDLPSPRGLATRVVEGVRAALAVVGRGDILVFLPGKAEIDEAATLLARRLPEVQCRMLHARLSAREQDEVFQEPNRVRVVLSTNVAESSVTLPWVRAVVDSGLERRTSYRRGRSVLALSVVSVQSADQRAGRAGRLGPGHCIRLWSERAVLRQETVPEILREDLDALVLAAATLQRDIRDMDFLDPPSERAVALARGRLQTMTLLDAAGRVTPEGERVADLPLDPDLGRLVSAAREHASRTGEMEILEDMVDLVATLAVQGLPVPGSHRSLAGHDTAEEPPYRCDVAARVDLLRGVAGGLPRPQGGVWREARRTARQLRGILGLDQALPRRRLGSARPLAAIALRAVPQTAFVKRRKRYAGAGLEAELGPSSLVPHSAGALAVFELHSTRDRGMRVVHRITCATPIPPSLVLESGLAKRTAERVAISSNGSLVGDVVWRFQGVELQRERNRVLEGDLAPSAAARLLLLEGTWRSRLFQPFLRSLRSLHLAASIGLEWARRAIDSLPPPGAEDETIVPWIEERFRTLGIESGRDLGLIEPQDLLPEGVEGRDIERFAREFPAVLDLRDRACEVHYDPTRRQVMLSWVKGRRDPPPRPTELPPWPGWKVVYRVHSRTWRLR